MLAGHREWLRHILYAPKLSLKKGEQDVFKSSSPEVNASILPLFVVPPAGDFDHELGYIPSPAEHIKNFGKRLFACRNTLPVFIDALFLDDKRHRAASETHPLTALLERARLFRAQAWPMTGFDRSDEYQKAVERFHLRHQSPVAIEIGLADLEASSLAVRLTSLCNQISCDPGDVILVANAGALQIPMAAENEFVSYLITRLNELPKLYEWAALVFCSSCLSSPQKIAPNQQKTLRRGVACTSSIEPKRT